MSMRHLINLYEASIERKRRTSDAEFIQMAQAMFGDKAAKLSLPDMMQIADRNGVQIPSSIRHNRDLKLDAHYWNLSGQSPDEASVDTKVAQDLGIEVEKPDGAPEEYDDAIRLSRAKTMSRLAATGKIYLFGRKAKGAFFRIQGFDEYAAQLERMLSRELAAKGDATMEEQYELLREKVDLIASGKSTFIKSLLITGAPSSGKTYTVMGTVQKTGLVEGKDYIIKKGRITVTSMYRTLIEQLNGLTIFDDCDSVVEDKNGVNMLKGALDTDPVREISYDVRGTINVASLPAVERDEYVERLSRVLRYIETQEDTEYFKTFLAKIRLLSKVLKGIKRSAPEREVDREDDDDEGDMEDENDEGDQEETDLILNYVRIHMPNKIDFKGRIIFISNLEEDDWDGAILTRAFYQNMSFRSDEMLDFIDRIKDNMPTPSLTDEQKQEVWDFIRQLYQTGKLRRPVNFRLAQQAFDLRVTNQWQKMLSQL